MLRKRVKARSGRSPDHYTSDRFPADGVTRRLLIAWISLVVAVAGTVVIVLWLEVFGFPAVVEDLPLFRAIIYPAFGATALLSVLILRIVRRSEALTEELSRSKARYRSVFNASSDAILIHSFDGVILDANDAAQTVYGYAREQFIGRSLESITSTPPEEGDSIRRALESGERDSVVIYPRDRRADGSEFPAEVRVSVIRDRDEPYCIAAVSDLNTVREQERQIAFQSQILDAIAQSIFVVDREGRVVFANRYAGGFVGLEGEDLIGVPVIDSFVVEADRPEARRILEAANNGHTTTGEVVGQTAGSFPVPTLIIATPMPSESNRTERTIVLVVDIREQKRMERELLEAKAAAEQNAQAKSVFLASMSHEIRTPLNGIIGFADLLMQQDPRDDQREALSHLLSAGRSLMTILGDVLSISKLESGRYTLRYVPFDLDEVLARLNALYTPAAEERGIELSVERADQTPPELIGDPDRILQVLSNLVSNGIKYTVEGHVSVRVHHEPTDTASGITLRMDVHDTGIGIAEADMPRLFHFFERIDGRDRIHGTGLGLAISDRLVRSMEGSISVESTFGEGSTFTVRVPVGIAEQSEQIDLPPVDEPQRASGPLHVLVVDDDAVNRLVAKRLLEAQGHTVEVVPDGAAAVKAAVLASGEGGEPFDLILMDYLMPELDGIGATEQIRSQLGDDLVVVGLSASVYEDDRVAMLQAGMNDVVSKPVTGETLADILTRFCEPA